MSRQGRTPVFLGRTWRTNEKGNIIMNDKHLSGYSEEVLGELTNKNVKYKNWLWGFWGFWLLRFTLISWPHTKSELFPDNYQLVIGWTVGASGEPLLKWIYFNQPLVSIEKKISVRRRDCSDYRDNEIEIGWWRTMSKKNQPLILPLLLEVQLRKYLGGSLRNIKSILPLHLSLSFFSFIPHLKERWIKN